MKKRLSGFPIKRETLFTLADGTYVVQWSEQTVRTLFQNIPLTYRADRDYGAPVSDFELHQLKLTHRISHFNQQYVWLSGKIGDEAAKDPVPDFKRVTRVSRRLQTSEIRASSERTRHVPDEIIDNMDTGQMIRTMMSERQVLLVLQNPKEQELLRQLLTEMQFEVAITATAEQGLRYLEDHAVNLLITDLYLPDMHAWQMIAKIQEIARYSKFPILVIADEVMPTMRAFAGGEHIPRPVSVPRLRYHLWKVLQDQSHFDNISLKTTSLAED
jgi:CheY-like chemotaxis protein